MPRTYPRLSRTELIARLRAHAAVHGSVSLRSLHKHDPIAERSVMLHFHGLVAARHAAGVTGPSRTAAKPSASSRTHGMVWSRDRVIAELRRLHREGQPTAHTDLLEAGYVDLISAAREYAGGLRKARELARVPKSTARISGRRQPHSRESIVREIRARHRARQSLKPTAVPQHLFSAARYRFGSWPAAIAAAKIEPKDYRPKLVRYTRKQIIEMLRTAADSGSDLTKQSLGKVIRPNAIRREFGTLDAALIAAGLRDRLAQRKHGAKIWNRERIIETLRARAARKKYRLTPKLFRAVALHFGSAEEARRVAGVPSPTDIRMEQRRKAKLAIAITERTRRRRRYE